jgi:hypothetical protein
MHWKHAQHEISTRVKIGTNVNTPRSTYRFIQSVDSAINSARYEYRGEQGFVVSIGQSSYIDIPWNMLSECFTQLAGPDGYDGKFFRRRFPLQANDHPCHVHVVGQILVAAGIAYADAACKKYRLVERQN